jgi:hypothetical protein
VDLPATFELFVVVDVDVDAAVTLEEADAFAFVLEVSGGSGDGFAISRINPSCAVETQCTPDRVKNFPKLSDVPFDARGLYVSCSNHSSARNGA